MIYVKRYYKRIKNELKRKMWYHQRFDGCPFLLSFIAEAELKKEIRKYDEGSHTTRVCFFNNNRADWYLLMDDIVKTTNMFLRTSKEDPDFSKKLIKRWDNDNRKFYDMCERLGKINLAGLSDKQLIELYRECRSIGVNRQTSSSLIDGFALGSDEIIAKKILNHLTKLNLDKEYPEMFSILTAPVHLSFINGAEISLLKIACEIDKNRKLKDIFLNKNPKEIEEIIKKHPKVSGLLKRFNFSLEGATTYSLRYYSDYSGFSHSTLRGELSRKMGKHSEVYFAGVLQKGLGSFGGKVNDDTVVIVGLRYNFDRRKKFQCWSRFERNGKLQ